MKRITLVLDGSADRANPALGGKTPLEAAVTPHLDGLARRARLLGRTKNIPHGLEVGSAVANMGLLGFDPRAYQGRAALEAAGSGIPTKKENLYIRMNLVHLEGPDYERSVLADYSAHEIPTHEAKPIAALLSEKLFHAPYRLHYVGSFRSVLEIEGGAGLYPMKLAPAHDIIGQGVNQFIHGKKETPLMALQKGAYELLKNYGGPCNGVWFWGDSLAPDFPQAEKGRCAFSETILMKGITAVGGIPNFPVNEEQPFDDFLKQKAELAVEKLHTGFDRAYVHVQATDDLSHDRNPIGKAQALSAVDRVLLPILLGGMKEDFLLLILSDHFTFSDTGAHGGEPVPFLLFDSRNQAEKNPSARFTEACCASSPFVTDAPGTVALMEGNQV